MTSAGKNHRRPVKTPAPETLADFAQCAYSELRRIAGHYFKREQPGRTLQPTALVNEVYVRLARNGPKAYQNRSHFFGVAAKAMRQILVDEARRRGASKRAGHLQRVSLSEIDVAAPELPDYAAIDSALERLSLVKPRLAQVAELRVFAGLSVREAAEVLKLAPSTVRALWAAARTWLEKEIQSA